MLTPGQESTLLQMEGTMTDEDLACLLMTIGINTKKLPDTNTKEEFANLVDMQKKVPVLFSPVFATAYEGHSVVMKDGMWFDGAHEAAKERKGVLLSDVSKPHQKSSIKLASNWHQTHIKVHSNGHQTPLAV